MKIKVTLEQNPPIYTHKTEKQMKLPTLEFPLDIYD